MKFIVLILFFASFDSYSHSGRTNSSGCHNNRKTGGYHCHNGGLRLNKTPTNKVRIKDNRNYRFKKTRQTKNTPSKRNGFYSLLIESNFSPEPPYYKAPIIKAGFGEISRKDILFKVNYIFENTLNITGKYNDSFFVLDGDVSTDINFIKNKYPNKIIPGLQVSLLVKDLPFLSPHLLNTSQIGFKLSLFTKYFFLKALGYE